WDRSASGLAWSRDGKTIYTDADNVGNHSVFAIDVASGNAKVLVDKGPNDARVKAITWGESEQFSFKGAKGDTVYGYAIKPAGYKAGKAPVAFLIHGGPQGSFSDHFHYRWNPQVFAGHGFAVVMIDFHGSTGYGQAF